MSMKKLLLFSLVFFSVISIAYGFGFTATVKPIEDKIPVDGRAIFNITVKNQLNTTEEFRVRNFDYPMWDINTKPLSNPITATITPYSESTIQIFVSSLQPSKTLVGTYSVNARIDMDSQQESQDIPLTVVINSTEALIDRHIPNVKLAVTPQEADIDPRQPFVMKISLANLNPIHYEDLKINVRGNLIKEELKTSLSPPGEDASPEPNSQKTLTITKNFDKYLPPQRERIYVEVLFGSRKIDSQTVEYNIAEYFEKSPPHEEKQVLKSKKTIKAFSNNPGYKGTIRLETTVFKNLFTSTEPSSELVKGEGRYYYEWNVDFEGKTGIEVSTTENFRPLFVMIAFAVILTVLYFIFRSPIVVKKEIANVRMSEGGISDMKVVLKVRNRSSNQLSKIEVSDSIPSIAEVEREISIGSMQPAKVLWHSHHRGASIKWDIETLEAGDERVLSYKFKSRLPILGEFTLPSASARCHYGKRHIISNSNRAVAGTHH